MLCQKVMTFCSLKRENCVHREYVIVCQTSKSSPVKYILPTLSEPLPSDILTLDHHKAHSCIIILSLQYFLT